MAPKKKAAGTNPPLRSLRDVAEELLARTPECSADLNEQTPEALIHELRVHQIELEIQAEELRKAHLALEESRDKYLNLYDFAPVGYLTLSDKALITEVNLTLATLLGTERSRLLNARFSKFIAEKDADTWYRYFLTVLKQDEKQTCSLMIRRDDGSTFPAWLESIRIPCTSNGPPKVRMVISDITKRKRDEESFRLLGRIADEAPVSVTVHDFEGNFLYANEETFRLHGFPREEFMEKNLHEIDVPESEHLIAKRMEQIRERGEADFEVQHYRKDGTVFPLHVNAKIVNWGGEWVLLSIATDLSERQRADRSLKESEERFRQIFKNSPLGMVLVSQDFRFVSVNPAWIAMTGYSEQELLKMSFKDITHPDHLSGDMEHMRELVAGIIPVYQTEKRYIRKDGSILWGFIRVTIIRDPQGTLGTFAAQIEDITERKRADSALRESKKELADIIEKNPLSIQIVDTDGFTLRVNPAHTLLFGSVPPPDFSIFADLQKKHPALENLILRAKSGDVVHLPDLSFNAHDSYPDYPDIPVWVRAIIFPLNDTYGKPERFVLMHENITERKAAEDALKKAHALLNETQEISRLGGWEYDVATSKITWTDEVYRIHGLGRDFDPSGVNRDIQFYTRKDMPVIREAFRRCCELGELYDLNVELIRADGRQIWVRTMGKPVQQDGRIVRVHGNIIDITERKRSEEQRENLIAELARKNAELDRFTYTVSHDLKSPLLSIRAFLGLLESDIKTDNTDRVALDIQRISESAEKLEQLITTLLSLSRSGRTVDTPLPVPLTNLAREAAKLLEVTLHQRNISLVIPDNLPVVKGDYQRLLQGMTNLLDNAVKFMGEQKDPRIEVFLQPGTGSPVLCVRDNGMGIRPENLEQVFGLFERFHPDVPGTGIGLATVKRIIEAHGGTIWVESEGEGKGTTVCFTLPVAGEGRTDNNNTA